MKKGFKGGALLLAGFFLAGTVLAQAPDSTKANKDYVQPFSKGSAFRTWSFGIHGGVLTTNTLFQSNNKLDFTSPNGEIGYGAYIKKQIFPSFGLQIDFLAGKLSGDHSQPGPAKTSPYKSFNTRINYSGSLSASFTLANINWSHQNSGIQLFLISGAGIMNYTPVLTTYKGVTSNFKTDGDGSIHEIYVPAGMGIKINVAKGVNLEFGYQVNFVYNDNLDGFNYGSINDKFSYGHFGIEFALGKRSKPQLAAHNPVASMRTEYLNQSRLTQQGVKMQLDSQNVKNAAIQKQLTTVRDTLSKITTDSDGDGVPDFYDKCPNTPAGTKVDGSGCPLPLTFGVTEADKKVALEAMKDLQFSSGRAMVSESSFESLDLVAQLMKEKGLHIKLAGYTDATGSAALNLRLSQERADAVKYYLISKGVKASQIQAIGYGKAQPIASNRTAAGRKLNRRVEFTLY